MPSFLFGLTNGTTATTYSPTIQCPANRWRFNTRTMDQSLTRGSRRAALDQYWTTPGADSIALTSIGRLPELVKSDEPIYG